MSGHGFGANSGNWSRVQGSEQKCDAKHILITWPGKCTNGAFFFFFSLDQHFECPLVEATFPPSHKSTLQLSNNVGFWALRCSELMKHGKSGGVKGEEKNHASA